MLRHLARTVVLSSAGVETRHETFNGKEYLVVPVVALVEGVIHAMNAETPELVTAEEFMRAPAGWNGRPVFYGHPMRDEKPVIGNTPDVLESEQVGIVFNAGVKNDKLAMEAWVDEARAQEVAPRLLERIAAGDPIEISVGVFVETNDDDTGTYQGKRYSGEWSGMVPDHLALLPEDEVGACSRKMGCGVRAAKGVTDVSVKAENQGMLSRLLQMFRTAQPASEMSDNDVRRKLYDAVKELDPRVSYVDPVYPDRGDFVYCVYSPDYSKAMYYRRNYTLSAEGVVTVTGDPTEVEPVMSYEPVVAAGAVPAVTPPTTASGTPCSCKHPVPSTENKIMKERVKNLLERLAGKGFTMADAPLLEAASEAQLDNLEKLAEPAPAVVVVPAAVVTPAPVAEPVAASAAVVAPTFDTLLAAASPEVRDMFNEGLRVGKARKAASVKTLRESGRCDLTDAQLNAKGQEELDQLVKLAGIKAAATVESVDYGAQAPRAAATEQAVPAAPDMGEAIRAAQAKK